ncbi:uncharacterized protein N7446_007694 [Penicillium canescens]|uniref:FAD-binding domain-containing protein n=1 Tax=Penicillium canescens TaxID=5083 RepID=A0AAD6NDA7_PENCN|nr:uncharacterized protein N7446_007694 [Penicillium canescens]KAJ6056803.1 hypothetical protein N7460_000077 [Penicillium canescens]KAJ6058111.1 hypothetical protein N7446_007694 [Penicillium canescens]
MVPEIAIVGGGPSGLALAGVLEQYGIDYVVYERSREDVPPRGVVLKEAGCFEEFKKYARGGYATIHWLWDYEGNKLFPFGEGRDSPEIDRAQLKRVLLSSVPKHKIRWSAGVQSSSRNENGEVQLNFTDGTTTSGFKLVVGADGLRSKIRHLVTAAEPQYAGMVFLTLFVRPSNSYHADLEQLAGQGPMIVTGKRKKIWIQRQGDSHYRVDFGWLGPEDFPVNGEVDLSDEQAVKKYLLRDEHFGRHMPLVHDLINASEGPFRTWPLYYFPTEHLNWQPAPGATLIGDAAHVTTPFVGDGVNFAMRDSLILAQKLKQFGVSSQAVAEYEKEMFPYAIDVITRSVASGELFFAEDSPKGFMKMMASDKPLVRFELDY